MDDNTNPASMPTYKIFRDQHGIPQFSPKRGTQSLKDALIYAFPTLETELQLMQAALKKFFDSERGIQIICELPENDLQTSLAKKRDVEISPIQSQKAGLRNWKVGSGCTRPSSRLTSRPTSRAPSRTGSRAGSRPSSRTSSCAREGSVDFNGAGLMTTWSLESGRELERKKKSPYDPVKRRKVAENRGNACEKHRAAKSACNPLICPQNKMFGKVPDASDDTQDQQAEISGTPETNVDAPVHSVQNAVMAIDRSNPLQPPVETSPPYQDFVALPADADVFWEASDLVKSQDMALNFGHMSTSSYAGSWTDSSYTDLLSWSPNSSCMAAPESTEGSLVMAPKEPFNEHSTAAQVPAHNTVDDQADPRNVTLPLPHNCPLQHYPSLSYPSDETPAQTVADPEGQTEANLTCSEDPFMGWASKRASQMFDEYNWVLSHVETL